MNSAEYSLLSLLYVGVPVSTFLSGFPIKTMFSIKMRSTCLACLVLDLFIQILFDDFHNDAAFCSLMLLAVSCVQIR